MARSLMVLGLSVALLVSLGHVGRPISAQTTSSDLKVNGDTFIPQTTNGKYPHVITYGTNAHFSTNFQATTKNKDGTAYYFNKADSSLTFPSPQEVGTLSGKADFTSTSIASGPDGSIYFVWIANDSANNIIKLRRRAPSGTWDPERVVTSSGGFKVFVEVGVSNAGVFVAWRVPEKPIFYTRSTDGGVNWSSPVPLESNEARDFPWIAGSSTNQLAIAFARASGVVFAAIWNGSAFVNEQVSPARGLFFTDVSIAIGPTGKYYAGYRGVDNGAWFSERQASGGAWTTSQLAGGDAVGPVAVSADGADNIHVTWLAIVGGAPRLYYAFRAAGSTRFEGPLEFAPAGGIFFNARSSSNASDRAYAHTVLEDFGGIGLRSRYVLFSARSQGAISATPGLNIPGQSGSGNLAVPVGKPINVAFSGVTGEPNQIRWRWGAAPTDQASDSGGWASFTNPISITVPANLATSGCDPVALYTQVRNTANNVTESSAKALNVRVDPSVQALPRAINPDSEGKSSIFTPLTSAALADYSTDSGASNGHPDYSRRPLLYLEFNGVTECSALRDFAIGKTAATLGRAYTISNNFFANNVPFPDPAALSQGQNNVVVRVRDTAGNELNFTRTFTYDTVKPVLAATSPGSFTITPGAAQATVISKLVFSNVSVNDNLYPGRKFWGMWIANSRSQIANPLTDTTLYWTPVVAPAGTGASFTLDGWSLAVGLKGNQLAPGDFYVYVRFLDGAGNATDGVLSAKVTLSSVTLPTVRLPFIRR